MPLLLSYSTEVQVRSQKDWISVSEKKMGKKFNKTL